MLKFHFVYACGGPLFADQSTMQMTSKPDLICIWRVCLLALGLEMLASICGLFFPLWFMIFHFLDSSTIYKDHSLVLSPYFSHGMSYPIAGNVKTYKCRDYDSDHPIVVSIQLIGSTDTHSPQILLIYWVCSNWHLLWQPQNHMYSLYAWQTVYAIYFHSFKNYVN